MAGGGDSVMWLRVEDEEIDAAKLLRVTVNENTTRSGRKRRTSLAAAEDSRSSEGRYWLARIIEEPYQNPQDFMYCGEQFGKGYYIAKIHWYRCVRRGVLRSYKEEREVSYLSMNAVIRTDGAVKMTKPPSGKRKGELDLSSEEQTRIFNAA